MSFNNGKYTQMPEPDARADLPWEVFCGKAKLTLLDAVQRSGKNHRVTITVRGDLRLTTEMLQNLLRGVNGSMKIEVSDEAIILSCYGGHRSERDIIRCGRMFLQAVGNQQPLPTSEESKKRRRAKGRLQLPASVDPEVARRERRARRERLRASRVGGQTSPATP